METPIVNHMKAAKRILRYLKGTIEFGLFYSPSNNFKLSAYCDSDFAGDLDDLTRLHEEGKIDHVTQSFGAVLVEYRVVMEVDSLVMPEQRQYKNEDLKTPIEVFYVEHADMVASEGQWVTGMANSCTVATTVISTIAFASAITVPGGYEGDGRLVLHGGIAYTVFAVSNALVLFSSVSTLCIMEEKVWEHPEEWRPERFLDENNNSVDLYKMTTFGGGKREVKVFI
ncbi:hypothetical protein RJ640_000422 [Escallonia rubra]|uniref:PGG domain-containing protein n=1 Tax=Escallonia rubra TaxID=112253 RepID=A0AA88RED3_9ASTE|nr:hypothetical protein RJ640_000422 [Escallonia rubra]